MLLASGARGEESVMPRSTGGVAVGQFRRQIKLGSEAIYRVCARDRNYVHVEVVSAPGLRPGERFRFTRAAVEVMELLTPAAPVR
jgi:hypothetical protein